MASLFIRTYTFVDGTTAYGSQVESEISNIVTVLNNLNTAATNWGLLSVLHATSVPLVADCSSGTQDIADFKNNSVIKASISSTGVITSVPTSNQIVLGTTRTITLSATQPASSSRVYTFPDAGAAADVILSKGTPTMGAALAMGANKVTGLANGTAATDAAAFGQIYYGFQAPVQGTSSTGSTTTSATFASTNCTATITPTSASHRIKITVSTEVTNGNEATDNLHYSLKRGSTDLGAASNKGFGSVLSSALTGSVTVPVSIVYIDSPASTSSTVYTFTIRNEGGAVTMSCGASACLQVMTLEEIV